MQPPVAFHSDILARGPMPGLTPGLLDVYSFTSPCQSLSAAGCQRGASDVRSQLAFYAIAFIEKYAPKVIISENAATLATHIKISTFRDVLTTTIAAAGYHVDWRVINTDKYLPQHRARWYMVAIKNGFRRLHTCGIPLWPDDPESRPQISQLVKPLTGPDWKPLPDNTGSPLHKANVLNAYKGCSATVNPFITPVLWI